MSRFIGQYEVIKELGAGQFGAVYLAVGDTPSRAMQPARRRVVAIKQLRERGDREALRLLLQEFALLDQVKHRGIVRAYECLQDENAVVMEYIHGVTLREVIEDLLRSKEQFFTEAVIEVGCELADALYQAYTTPGDNGEPLRLVHRDMKPANVMITPTGEVKILDFGLARADNREFARETSAVRGTPIYMAPEQARGEEVDHRTDLFSAGLILYELLMRRPAYQVSDRAADPAAEILRAISSGDLREQCISLEQTLPALGPVISRLLQPMPEARYRSGQDLLVDLKRQLFRDRGAYLKEFCDFYFGTIHPIGDAPTPEGAGSGGGRGRRKTLEERLRDSMGQAPAAPELAPPIPSRPGPATAAPPPPRPSLVSASPGRSTPNLPPTSTPAPEAPPRTTPAPRIVTPRATAPSVPPEEGDPMSSSAGGRKPPPRPPVGGSASRATPFEPPAEPAPRRPPSSSGPKSLGERRPDEAGMLEMVPLSSSQDKAEVEADPSATSFFAIPAPKAERSRASAPPPPVQTAGPIGVVPPGQASPIAVSQPPPVARAPIGMAGSMPPMAPPMAPQPMVQGPVVSYGAAQPASPFQVSGPGPVAPTGDPGARVQSNRVYAIILAVFLLVGVAVVAAIWFRPDKDEDEKPVSTAPTPPASPVKPPPAPDTGTAPEPAPKPVAKAPSKPRTTTPKPAAPASGPATLSVKLADGTVATSVEVTCPSGFRSRSALSGGSGSIASVPQEKCTLYFKGGAPAQYGPVHGGQSLKCSIVGTTAVCN